MAFYTWPNNLVICQFNIKDVLLKCDWKCLRSSGIHELIANSNFKMNVYVMQTKMFLC